MKTMLVPVDFSPAMDCVLALARQMAQAFGADLHLIHVREIVALPVFPAATVGYPGIGMPEMGMAGGAPNEKGKSRLSLLQEDLAGSGLKVAAREPEGTVVSEILKVAQNISADLIIMGSHGHGSVYNLLVGSVTEGVLKASKHPVLLVPAPRGPK